MTNVSLSPDNSSDVFIKTPYKNTKLNKLTLIDKRHNVIKDIVHDG